MKYVVEIIGIGLAVTLVMVSFGNRPPMLQQEALSKPELITGWLKQNAAADRRDADWFFKTGVKAMTDRRWSLAAKAFGDSALRFPTPQALMEYADAWLHMLHEIRSSPGNAPVAAEPDLAHAEKIFRSALAANALLNSLNAREKEQTEQDATCLASYIQSHVETDCRPLHLYRHGN